eukprot:1386849-Rhodomonas_salina.2
MARAEKAAVQRATDLDSESEVESYCGASDFESDSNEDEFVYSLVDWNPDIGCTHSAIPIVHQAATFSRQDHITDTACMDTGANTSVANGKHLVTRFLPGAPWQAQVSGFDSGAVPCQRIEMGIPTVTTTGKPILFQVPGPSILLEGANAILLAVGPMKHSGIRVKWREGTKRNAKDRGYIQLQDGLCIAMTFENDLWHLPVFASAMSAGRSHSVPVAVTAVTSGTILVPNSSCNANCFSVLAGTQKVADALTKSLPYPSFSKHREYLQGSGIPFEAFYATISYWAAVTATNVLDAVVDTAQSLPTVQAWGELPWHVTAGGEQKGCKVTGTALSHVRCHVTQTSVSASVFGDHDCQWVASGQIPSQPGHRHEGPTRLLASTTCTATSAAAT